MRERELYVISDEVYEHIVFDGRRHHSVLSSPELRARSVAVLFIRQDAACYRSARRLCGRAARLTAELRKVHQFNTFTIATALQWPLPAT